MKRVEMGRVGARKRLNAIMALVMVVMVLCGAAATYAFGQVSDARSAVVHDADGNEHWFALDQDVEQVISSSAGSNTIVVENGTVRVSEADCPNHDCVEQGAIFAAGQQIVCLPHKLTVDISDADAASEFDVVGK